MQKVMYGMLSLLLLLSCQNTNNKIGTASGGLEGSAWVLVSISDQPIEKAEISLQFQGDKLNGKAVCNRYFSDYSTAKKTLKIGNIGSTKMMCPEQSKLEHEYLELLAEVEEYAIKKDQLHLKAKSGSLIFKRAPITSEESTSLKMDGPGFEGTYVTIGYPKRYWQSLSISASKDSYDVKFTASKIQEEPGCTFSSRGTLKKDTLYVPIKRGGVAYNLILLQQGNKLQVHTQNPADRLQLMQFCRGGATLAGEYYRKAPFELQEHQLEQIALKPPALLGKRQLSQAFPDWAVVEEQRQEDEQAYVYYTVAKNGAAQFRFRMIPAADPEARQLDAIISTSPELSDEYGARTRISFSELQALRPDVKLYTDPHFHTYALAEDSHIRYEICCNEDELDRTDWTIEQVQDWKVKSIIWQAPKTSTDAS